MSKLTVNIYVTHMSATEHEPPLRDGDLIPVKTGIVHPDCTIRVWRLRGVSTAGRFDQIQHCVQIAVQNSGMSVAALRNEQSPKTKRGYTKREVDARKRTQSMFEDDNT